MRRENLYLIAVYCLLTLVVGGRQKYNPQVTLVSAGSQQVPKVGYLYPVPKEAAASTTRAQLKFPPLALPRPSLQVERLPSASAQEPSIQQLGPTAPLANLEIEREVEVLPREDETPTTTTVEAETSPPGTTTVPTAARDDHHLHHHHSAQIDAIDVACGKEKMTVRVTFDAVFDGIIYAKGHYADPKCRFVSENSGQTMYMFELATGQCGVSFIDDGLTEGGQAYVEGLLVIIVEPGVQEAWDASRKIRCLWEGNLEQTVTFPLSVNMLEQKLLTFSGDTATVSLEIQAGDGPRAAPVQGLVRIGDMLTAVVTVQGDADFDILVRNCVATDGTLANRIILSDTRGCATKSKLMGGWTKEKETGGVLSYSKLSAFKFPDVMDLFLECTVSLCKGACEECPATEYLELHVPAHDDPEDEAETSTLSPDSKPTTTLPSLLNLNDTSAVAGSNRIDVKTVTQLQSKRRSRRTPYQRSKIGSEGPPFVSQENENVKPHEESLRLRRVVHVVGPDDFPEFSYGTFASSVSPSTSTIYGTSNSTSQCQTTSTDCFSLLSLISSVAVTALLLLVSVAIFGTFRRRPFNEKC